VGVEQKPPAAPRAGVAELLALRERVVPRGVSTANATVIASSEGAAWTDADGREWIDFSGGIGTLNVGAGNPAVRAALHRQVDTLLHTCSHVAWNEPYLRVAERLAGLTPVEHPAKVLLCSTGAEAVENAVKIARVATGRPRIVAFHGAFHGRSLMALSLTGKERPYKQDVGPLSPDVLRADYAYCRRCPLGLRYPDCGVACLGSLRQVLADHGDSVAAVIVEPVLGEGGFVVPPPEFLPQVAEMTRAAGALLIADEVQTGMGRTGRLFACEHTGVRPDMLLTAKSLAGGMPLAAVVGRADVMDAPAPGVLGGTYAGNPVACAAALAVLDLLADGTLLRRAEALGERAMARLRAFAATHDFIGDVRGLGAMVAVEIVDETGAPDAERTRQIQLACARQRLVTIRAGVHDNVVRLLFPLTIDDETFDAGLDRLGAALATQPLLQPAVAG
jgi:4-aminobutyrate aminotransferase/(S)-3-amino-2-methylpropionate transaminase